MEKPKYNEQEDLAMRALGEVATIKIIEKLREDEGGIYGGGARGSLNKSSLRKLQFQH